MVTFEFHRHSKLLYTNTLANSSTGRDAHVPLCFARFANGLSDTVAQQPSHPRCPLPESTGLEERCDDRVKKTYKTKQSTLRLGLGAVVATNVVRGGAKTVANRRREGRGLCMCVCVKEAEPLLPARALLYVYVCSIKYRN